MEKGLIKNLELSELRAVIESMGHKSFRAEQVFDNIYKGRIESFENMRVLPGELRKALDERYIINSINSYHISESRDGTRKFLFTLTDGLSIESALIPNDKDSLAEGKRIRNTLCVSSQIGCSVGCVFCATGKLKMRRNLSAGEIVDQVINAERASGARITNIVFMGMGEPLLNYENTLKAVRLLSDEKYGLTGRKRITVSTSGIVPQIYRLADENIGIKLAISLHATTNGLRSKLMPIARKYDLKSLGDAAEYYYRKTKLPVTYEYIPFDGLNDGAEDVKRLARITGRVPSKINIIPFHDISFTAPEGFAAELKPSSNERYNNFAEELRKAGVNVFKRTSSGLDIDAACGQLAFSKRKKDL